ncbi:MAG: hypothetical protein KF735_14405 [Chelatococcus sp.]|uniref:hypothetical protein n=1 Tax=Chelatococcus sp. TaxID=1953771 RepID=UPI0025C2C197|nr:hypothetical protein [Chelatococcus sp.]MBX3538835.1 hypothetical protein [Chelatococcus sp.]
MAEVAMSGYAVAAKKPRKAVDLIERLWARIEAAQMAKAQRYFEQHYPSLARELVAMHKADKSAN